MPLQTSTIHLLGCLELWQGARVVGRGASAAKCAIVISITELHNFGVARTEVYLYKLSVLKLWCRVSRLVASQFPQARRFCDRNLANKRSSRAHWRIFPRFLFNEMSFVNSAIVHSSYIRKRSSLSWRCAHETPFIRPSRRFDIESDRSCRWRDIYQVVASKFGSRRPYPDVSTTHGAKSGEATGVYFRTRRIFYTARYSIACTL